MSLPRAKRSFDGAGLALVPAAVALLLGALVLPRTAPPGDVPLPIVDGAALSRVEDADRARARQAAENSVSADVRAAGDAYRAFDTAEAIGDPDTAWGELRANLDRAVALAQSSTGAAGLLALRSFQIERFIEELRAFERTGKATTELDALGGGFLRRMASVGWLRGRRLAMDEHALRAAFKLKWNATTRLDAAPEFALSLDETRALYAFYIENAHPAEGSRAMIDAARKNARTQADCEALDEGERLALESWRLEKVVKLAAVDSAYPGAYARGVAEYRAGHYEASARALQNWIDQHPEGAYTTRARNHLRAAMAMASAR